MNRIKSFKLFENQELEWNGYIDEIDLEELEDIIIDFRQVGLEYDISVGSSIVVNFDKFNKSVGGIYITSHDLISFSDGTNKSLSIDFFKSDVTTEFDIDLFEEGYNMITGYLKDEYELVPNYIYIQQGWKYRYFENVSMLRKWFWESEGIKFNKLTLGYYKK